jgi:[acyl-carrier-protein] S-malonyltransferase
MFARKTERPRNSRYIFGKAFRKPVNPKFVRNIGIKNGYICAGLKNCNMKAYVFPGQGAQYPGMGKDMYENSNEAKALFEAANGILGFRITDIMFEGSVDDLKQTKITQPAIFLHSVILAKTVKDFHPEMVAGHSLGEFSALVANGALAFEDGLKLVSQRALAMQKACEMEPSAMAAIVGLPDEVVEEVCSSINEIVVPANYNCPGQLVISGSIAGIDKACEKLAEKGAKRALKLVVGGAFHSPLMEPAREQLAKAIDSVKFNKPVCPVYQNVNALPTSDPSEIKKNLIAQLTAPVKWAQTVLNMVNDGAVSFTEIGPGKVLQGLILKINKDVKTEGLDKFLI